MPQCVSQRGRTERTAREDHSAVPGQQTRGIPHLLAQQADAGFCFQSLGHPAGESCPVHSQGLAGRHRMQRRALQYQATLQAQLGLHQPVRVGQICAFEAVGADQLRAVAAVVRFRHALWAHFIEIHMQATAGKLPSCLAARKACSDHRNVCYHCWPSPWCG